MRKELIIVFAFLLVLASCTDGGPAINNQKTFLGGTTGLLINFVAGEPPTEVTDGGATPFTVTMKLENKGEVMIPKEKVTLTLKGFDSVDFGVSNPASLTVHPLADILKNDINPDTGQAINSPPEYVTFPTLNFGGRLSGNSVFPFMVDVCYNYQTKATSQMCIKENLLDSADTNVCSVSGEKTVQNSGAPVQITSFQEFSAGPDKVSFTITIKNVGNGLLSKADANCDDAPANKDVVKLTVDTHIVGLTCSGLSNTATAGTAYSGEVKLSTGERQVRCTQEIAANQKSDKIKIVDIFVDYGYKQSVSTNVLVKHI
ncbi:MAG: hypothetical protein KJ583_06980 [Nanoarchaeota archaeon]|nr:hypothetical protein [Nanoarchaeota archaeon]MBU1269210.1 hypothetical protein [Nanoarchaeota archaeon]MBU1605029.1 hypothetical protein [Nanoarchaeota archaeon]MBU2443581.1 hypothetical protein [Nanoarchaeota archaeon]